MKKIPNNMFVFICAGKNTNTNIPTASAMFFANANEASDELQKCKNCGWGVHYKGVDFNNALKALNSLKELGYVVNNEELKNLGA